jgi:hypothetical protein
MRAFLHTLFGKVVCTSTVVACAGAGAFVAVGAASGAAAPVDHFVCYDGSASSSARRVAPFAQTPRTVRLKDQFGTRTSRIRHFEEQCNPARVGTASAALSNPAAHLDCFDADTNRRVGRTLDVTGKFDVPTNVNRPVRLNVRSLRSLCVPTLVGANAVPAGTPTGLDAYACYSAGYASRSARLRFPSPVRVGDEFGTRSARVHDLSHMCVPAQTVNAQGNANPSALVSTAGMLLCFDVTGGRYQRTQFHSNAFGRARVRTSRTEHLCIAARTDSAPLPAPATPTTPAPTTVPTTLPPTTTTTVPPTTTTTTAPPTTTTTVPPTTTTTIPPTTTTTVPPTTTTTFPCDGIGVIVDGVCEINA